jgi:hypothetical protein
MIATCGNTADSVHLADLETEKACTLWHVFDMIHATEDDFYNAPAATYRLGITEEVAMFAKKYDMKFVTASIKNHLFALAAQYPPEGAGYCLVAAHLSEWALCGRLIETIGQDEDGHPTSGEKRMWRMLVWRGWTPEIIEALGKVSLRFVWAVCQAGTRHARSNLAQISYHDMGEDLAKLMLM